MARDDNVASFTDGTEKSITRRSSTLKWRRGEIDPTDDTHTHTHTGRGNTIAQDYFIRPEGTQNDDRPLYGTFNYDNFYF